MATASARELPLGAFASWVQDEFTDPLRLVHSVIDSLTAAPPDTPVIVGVDDAHLLDELSAFVLHQIVVRQAAKVIVTVRDGEPLPAALQDLWRGSHFERLDLQPLSMTETAELLVATLTGSVDPEVVRRLWKLTRGNVLYLRNIVEQELLDGRLAKHQAFWRWTGHPVLPPGLAELIDSRIGALPDPVSDVLDALAIGEPLELSALARITDPAAIEEADVRGLISLSDIDGTPVVRIAHPLYGEVRRNRAPATRLRRLRGLVAAELAASDHRDDMQIVVRRATLSLDADLKPPPELFIRAAHGAAWQVDVGLAERLADAAVRAGGGADALFIHAFLLTWLGRGAEAEHLLSGAADRYTGIDRAKLVFVRATNRLFCLGDAAGAAELIDGAEAHDGGCVDAARVVYCAATGDPRAALEASARIVPAELPDVAARMAVWAMTVAAGEVGRTSEAEAIAETGYPIGIRGYLVIIDAHLSAYWLAGRMADAQRVAEVLRVRASTFPSPQLSPVSVGVSGRAALSAGRVAEACSVLAPAVELMRASGDPIGWTYRYRLPLTAALAMSGRVTEAAASEAVIAAACPQGWEFLAYERALAQAWVAAAQGAVSEAIRTIRAAAETAGSRGQLAAEVACLQTAVQFGDGSCGVRLSELASLVEGHRAGLAARFAEALRAGDGVGLEAVSVEFEGIGDMVAAVDAASHAATAFRRAERSGSALTNASRARELARRCGGLSTPALQKASVPVPFTNREREIVALIGQGLSSREIAERLTLSVRTVEGHIYRAMVKTGAEDRAQLARMITG
ncbi:regulatory protein, luxR family [Mycolicibacterium rutilum]|uniref:Regulatory protein, luxR family n=2 Tax=Mycolicibacterium rutilum TaxID=370526 RepID=A0A1H6LCF9_MYCRU|nr:regulatory protein, luxR family [Mycolicibacterium rutilum]